MTFYSTLSCENKTFAEIVTIMLQELDACDASILREVQHDICEVLNALAHSRIGDVIHFWDFEYTRLS
jgi:hypothetical protein